MSKVEDGLAEVLLEAAEEEEARRRRAEEIERRLRLEIKRRLEEKKRRREEERKYEKWLEQKEWEAVIQFLMHHAKLENLMKKLNIDFYRVTLKSITDPSFEGRMVELWRKAGYDVDSLGDVEEAVKKFWTDALKEELKRNLEGNPYQWIYTWLT